MKRLTALCLLLALLLTACIEPAGTTLPASGPTEPAGTPTSPTEPTVSTDPTEPSTVPTDPTEPSTAPTDPTEPSTTPTQPQPTVCTLHLEDPYVDVDKEAFYENYTTACCYNDAKYRTQHYLMSGMLEVSGQYAQDADYRPMSEEQYVRNLSTWYEDDGNTYVVVDGYGAEVLRVYKGAAYITLEEVAAYMYAFGGANCVLPANYTSAKKPKPANSPWGEYLRANHSYFSGDTGKYPYEPALPDITGCGGSLQYYELDIGTTGTVTPGYPNGTPYNNGQSITRGAARLVYARQDKNRNGIYEQDEVYVFYTHNHYNDFREYLNYYGGWGEMFGNVTGGGVFDSKTQCNPTPYPEVVYKSLEE